ncbi:hypothetical protein D9758_003203 [Tetrapyrgos nigripes]|uniref:Fe2OG dioxygenase domain-containing protein n=1 Tax=Tetrapyrgos nigripes TaxID=182062 RepID=A0A8H5GJ60_9AGAR|nr:hypothetical protein D9758_003203 [Tetrapyrgos nigripes]
MDPASYKKARRHFLKSTRDRDNSAAHSSDWSPFRVAEKRFKSKFPPPDLSNVLDLALLDPQRIHEINAGGWAGRPDAFPTRRINLFDSDAKGYIFPHIPGLVVLPSFLSHQKQKDLVEWSLSEHSKQPNETNLDIHYILPPEGVWNAYVAAKSDPSLDLHIPPKSSVVLDAFEQYQEQESGPRQLINNTPADSDNFDSLHNVPKLPAAPSPTAHPSSPATLLPKLRWANIGWFYHWGTKQYDFTKGKIAVHSTIRDICKHAVRAADWNQVFGNDSGDAGDLDWGENGPEWMDWNETYEPDAGIVNFYQTKDTLMAHVDRSEVCATSPLVSISLGNAAIFLIGGPTRDTEPSPILLRSGDVVIMSGPACRRSYHGVPRILENTLPSHMLSTDEDQREWELYEQYMKTTRININVRQVFPKGFAPQQHVDI